MIGLSQRRAGLANRVGIGTSRNRLFQSALQMAKQAYPNEKRYKTRSFTKFQQHQQQQQQKRYNYQNKPFQLYNENQQTWANQIDTSPIVLSAQDIQKWLAFRTNTLQQHKLYLWHATQFDWIPLWSMENGFLLTGMDRLPYDNVSYNQLTKSKWIKQNSVTNEAIQKLLKKFNINVNINEMTPILNQQQQNGTTPTTGRTYYVNHLESNPKGNWIFNPLKRDWTDYKMYNMKRNKWNLLYLYNYKGTLHQVDQPRNNKQFKNIQDAIKQVDDGKYIYHEDPYYIPFDKFNDRVWFNHTECVKISEIKPKLNENAWLASNTKNYLVKEQCNTIYSMASSMFIDPKTNTYRDEFIINNIQTIPQYCWEKVATFARLFNQFTNSNTFMLLDESGRFGIPIGIDKNKNEIILNDRTRMSWPTFKTQFNNQNLIKYQNLDFQGLEYKLTQNMLDRHYIPPAQQIARVDLIKASKSLILQYMIGQYVLLDNGQDQYLPIYILSPTIVQSCAHLVHVEDINEYIG